MFRRITCLGLAAIAALALAPPARADDKMTARALVEKAIDAAGGLETLKKYPGIREKGKGTMDFNGVDLAFAAESLLSADKIKITFNVEFGGMKIKAVQTVNGDKVRLTNNGLEQPLEDSHKALMRELGQLRSVSLLYPLLEVRPFDVSLLDGTAKVGGDDAYVLAVKSRELREIKVFFDAKSFLVVKVEKLGLGGDQREGKQELFLSGHKKFDGIVAPTKSRVLHEGKKFMEMELSEVKMFEKIDPSEFDISD